MVLNKMYASLLPPHKVHNQLHDMQDLWLFRINYMNCGKVQVLETDESYKLAYALPHASYGNSLISTKLNVFNYKKVKIIYMRRYTE